MKRVVPVAMLVTLIACGGGGGSTPTAPSTPSTPTPSTFTFTGSVAETSPTLTNRVPGAIVTFTDGSNAGKTATADGAGNFTITGLQAGGFTVRASFAGYDDRNVAVTIPSTAALSLFLNPTYRQISETRTGNISGGDTPCYVGNPCQIVSFPIHNSGHPLSATLTWPTRDTAFLIFQIYDQSTDRILADSSSVAAPRQDVSINVSSPATLQLRVIALRISTIIPFTLTINRPN